MHAKSKKTRTLNGERRHRFGAHLSIAGGVQNALHEALALRCDVLQVFVKNQRQWQAPPLKPADIAAWEAAWAGRPDFGPVVAHATYLINLATADRVLRKKSIAAFTDELDRCEALGIMGLVVHPGSAGDGPRAAAVQRVARALNEIFAARPKLKTRVLLETTAGQGNTLGRTFTEIGAIVAAVEEPQRVGVCVDTCHVFAAGYDVRDPEAYAAMVAEAEKTVGLSRIACWHVNDSQAAFDSRRDRHAHIGAGEIGMAGFRNLLRDARFRGLPMILETPKGDRTAQQTWDQFNLRRLRAMAARV